MTSSAIETFQQLVTQLYGSNLHFYLSETPFSAQILIRKRFLKNKTSPSSNFNLGETSAKNQETSDFSKIQELQKSLDSSKEIIEILKPS